MSATVPPNLPPSPVTSLTAATAAARGSVTSAPNIAALTQGLSLTAQVVSSGSGQLVLATTQGRITVQSNAVLPSGASLVLQVQAAGQVPQVTLHFNQNPATPQGTGHAATARAGGGSPAPQTATVVTQLTEGSVHDAVVTRASGQGTQVANAATRAAGPVPPGVTGAATGAAPAGAAATAGGAPSPASAASIPLSAGAHLTVRVLAVAPPGASLPPAASLAPQPGAHVLLTTVGANQIGGSTVVSGAGAEFTLSNIHPLAEGSRLALEIVTLRPPAAGDVRAPLSFLGGRWEALGDALRMLGQIEPQTAQQVVETLLPTPGPRLAGGMLFFLSAMYAGDLRRFIGADAMRQLGRAPGAIGERLSSEFRQLRRTATDATGQEWRLYLIPILTGDGLEELRFMLHKSNDESANEDEAATRFMIEVNMSRLGPFQFDGLTRKKHLDLVVRTQRELPAAMREDMRSIFGNTITALGFTGTIGFRAVPRFDISPVEDSAATHRDLTV